LPSGGAAQLLTKPSPFFGIPFAQQLIGIVPCVTIFVAVRLAHSSILHFAIWVAWCLTRFALLMAAQLTRGILRNVLLMTLLLR